MKIEQPPLVLFVARLSWPNVDAYNLQNLADFAESLSEEYTTCPRFAAIPSRRSTISDMSFRIPFEPIVFSQEEDTQRAELFSDSIVFRFRKYESWSENVKMKLKSALLSLQTLGISSIDGILMEYIDVFDLPETKFSFGQYFTLGPSFPEKWDVNPEDFITGIDVRGTSADKFVIRVRHHGRRKEGMISVQLDSVYSKAFPKGISLTETDLILQELQQAHDDIGVKFLDSLTDRTKALIGVENEI